MLKHSCFTKCETVFACLFTFAFVWIVIIYLVSLCAYARTAEKECIAADQRKEVKNYHPKIIIKKLSAVQ